MSPEQFESSQVERSSPLKFLKCVIDSIRSVFHELIYQVKTSGTNRFI